MNPPSKMRILLCTLCSLVAIATAAQNEPNHLVKSTVEHSPSLLTYYFDVPKPQIQLNAQVSGRPGRTAVAVTLSEPAVSRFMPVVSPQMSGMTHQVVNTWQALKNLAVMFTRVDAVNKQQAPNRPRLFPRSVVALKAAADVPQAHTDVAAIMDAAEAQGQRQMWSETSPASVLLLPNGQTTAAVADVMHVSYDDKESVVRLVLDVVHEPHTISEFKPHGKQSLDADDAHYHFETAPGVKVDAAGLLSNLQASEFGLEGMHVFVKGGPPSAPCYNIDWIPDNETYFDPSTDVPQIFMKVKEGCGSQQELVQDGTDVVVSIVSGPANGIGPLSRRKGAGSLAQPSITLSTFEGSIGFELSLDGTAGVVDLKVDSIAGNTVNEIYTVFAVVQPPQQCYTLTFNPPNNTIITPPSTSPLKVTVNVLEGCFDPQTPVGDGTELQLTLQSGTASIATGAKRKGAGAKQIDTINIATQGGTGTASFVVNPTGQPGEVVILLDNIADKVVSVPYSLQYKAPPTPPPTPPSPSPSAPKLGRVTLSPLKAFRFLGDPIAIQATVFDTRGNIMPGVKVAITWFGECDKDVPRSSRQQFKTTDARGQATVDIVSDVPGVITVVAAAVYKGVAVWSQPANITYFGSAHSSHGHKGEYEGYNYGQDKDEPGEDYYRQKGGDHEEDYNRQKGGDHEEDYYRQKGDDHEEDYYRDAQLQQAEDQKQAPTARGARREMHTAVP